MNRSRRPASDEHFRAVADRLGRRLTELRTARDMSQEVLAETVDVSVRHIQKIESGRRNPALRLLVDLAYVLDVPVPELFAEPMLARRNRGRGRPRKSPGLAGH